MTVALVMIWGGEAHCDAFLPAPAQHLTVSENRVEVADVSLDLAPGAIDLVAHERLCMSRNLSLRTLYVAIQPVAVHVMNMITNSSRAACSSWRCESRMHHAER